MVVTGRAVLPALAATVAVALSGLIGAEVTVIAVKTRAMACWILRRAPNTRLNRYSVGRQIASVSRNRIGSLTAEEIACRMPFDDPSTIP